MPNRAALVAAIIALSTFPISAYGDVTAEIATAAQHAGLAAAASGIAQVHMHLHHVMNCLAGPADGDFDKTNMNPCAQQGKGALPDETNPDIRVKLQDAMGLVADGIASNDEALAKKNAAQAQTALNAIK